MRSRALKEEVMPSISMPKSRSTKEMIKEMHKSGKEDMMYGKEAMMRGKIKMLGAKMMMKNKDMGMEE